jgi:hypothetical protein
MATTTMMAISASTRHLLHMPLLQPPRPHVSCRADHLMRAARVNTRTASDRTSPYANDRPTTAANCPWRFNRVPGHVTASAGPRAECSQRLPTSYSGGRSADIWIILAPTERAMSSTCTTTP